MCARICLCYCMPNIIWLGIFRNVSHAVNHEAWSRPMQRSVWPHFWVISLCKSLGILSFVTGRDKVRLLLLPVRARLLAWDRLRCHLLNLYVALQLGKKERRKTRRIQSQPKTMGKQEGQAGGQSKVHVTPADNGPCIIFPGNCLCAVPSSQQKVAGV